MKKVVLSLGGSILLKGEDDLEYIGELRDLLLRLARNERLIVITGGGRTAREYISLARSLGGDEAALDWTGIAATRLNAWLLIGALGPSCYPRPAETVEEALTASSSFPIVVGGGTHPGHTTDTVAALVAERWGADVFVNMTAVNGAYTADPNRFHDAKRIDSLKSSELVELVSSTDRGAGSHSVLDPLAARIVHRAMTRTFIIDGRDLRSLKACIGRGKVDGTVVVPDAKGV